MNRSSSSIRRRFDRAGILLSGLCAVHCVLGLVLVSVLGLGGGLLLAPQIHEVGLGLAVAIGLSSLGMAYLRHRHARPLTVGLSGLALMAAALFVGHGPKEAFLTIAGVALVAGAHLWNLRHA